KMRWEQLDLDAGTWTLSREDTKVKRLHVVPLSEPAIAILRSLPQPEAGREGLVFSTTGETAISGFSRAKSRLDTLSRVSGWTLHDLRRTAASGMARMGFPPHVLSRVLNHSPEASEGITAIYNRHSFQPEMR